MSGRVLADEARKRLPWLKVLIMSGYSRNAIVNNGGLDPGVSPDTNAAFAKRTCAIIRT